MLTKDIHTCWPALRDDVSNSYRAKPLVHTPTGLALAARAVAASPDRLEAATQAPCAQGTGPTTCEDVPVNENAIGETNGDDGDARFISVADVIAMALTAGTTGAMQHAAGVAPPPPAQPTGSSAATAAPHVTTYSTAAASAAQEAFEEAQIARGYDTDSDNGEEAAAAESDGGAADDDKTDGDVDSHGVRPLFLANDFWTYASMYVPMPAAYAQGSTFAGASLHAGGFALRPAVWADVDQALDEDDDSNVSMASDDH